MKAEGVGTVGWSATNTYQRACMASRLSTTLALPCRRHLLALPGLALLPRKTADHRPPAAPHPCPCLLRASNSFLSLCRESADR